MKHLKLLINNKKNNSDNQRVDGSSEENPDKTLISQPSPFIKNVKKVKKRRDQFGVRIAKGKKEHKVSFIDDVLDFKLAEINYVESYKEIYRIQMNGGEVEEVNCKVCHIF